MILAFDDTDSVHGGCTTHAAFELVRRLEGVDLIGPPRLVRLNPNVPHKTRGNGAVALVLGHGRGHPSVIGDDGGRPLHAFGTGDPLSPQEVDRVYLDAQRWIGEHARLEDPKTHPGLVAFERPPDLAWYNAAVHRYVGRGQAQDVLASSGARFTGWKSGRGIVGASAAAAWTGRRGTFEWISYRDPSRWGTPRDLDESLGEEIDAHHPTTFDNHDPETGHLRIAPSSPCPVLGGVRGVDAHEVQRAARRLGPETAVGGLLFATNHATDDHATAIGGTGLRPFMAATIVASVARDPVARAGGHVFLRVRSDEAELDAVAFEPTASLRDGVRALRPGDRVRLVGGTHADPSLFALEKLEILDTVDRVERRAPDCPSCGCRMASKGRDQPHRCPRCGRRDVPPVETRVPGPAARAYEVPVRVRRHLSRPLALNSLVADVASF